LSLIPPEEAASSSRSKSELSKAALDFADFSSSSSDDALRF